MDGEHGKRRGVIHSELVALLPTLTRFALTLTRSRPDADDLVQETCERAIRNIDKWQPGTRLDSWLFRIAQNLYFNQRRKVTNSQRILTLVGATETNVHDGARSAEQRSMVATVGQHMFNLPREQREVVMLICVEGYSYKEAAAILDLPVGTVTSRLGRARSYLCEIMKEPKVQSASSAAI